MNTVITKIIHNDNYDLDWSLTECRRQKDILSLIDDLLANFEEYGCPENTSVQIIYRDGTDFSITEGFGIWGKYRRKNIHTIIYNDGWDTLVYGPYTLSEDYFGVDPVYPEITWEFTDLNGSPLGLEPFTGTYEQARIHANNYGRKHGLEFITVKSGNLHKTEVIIYKDVDNINKESENKTNKLFISDIPGKKQIENFIGKCSDYIIEHPYGSYGFYACPPEHLKADMYQYPTPDYWTMENAEEPPEEMTFLEGTECHTIGINVDNIDFAFEQAAELARVLHTGIVQFVWGNIDTESVDEDMTVLRCDFTTGAKILFEQYVGLYKEENNMNNELKKFLDKCADYMEENPDGEYGFYAVPPENMFHGFRYQYPTPDYCLMAKSDNPCGPTPYLDGTECFYIGKNPDRIEEVFEKAAKLSIRLKTHFVQFLSGSIMGDSVSEDMVVLRCEYHDGAEILCEKFIDAP